MGNKSQRRLQAAPPPQPQQIPDQPTTTVDAERVIRRYRMKLDEAENATIMAEAYADQLNEQLQQMRGLATQLQESLEVANAQLAIYQEKSDEDEVEESSDPLEAMVVEVADSPVEQVEQPNGKKEVSGAAKRSPRRSKGS